MKIIYVPGVEAFSNDFVAFEMEYAKAAGALDGSTVRFEIIREKLIVSIEHEQIEVQKRRFFWNHNNELVVHNIALKKNSTAPERFGIRMFLSQVDAARNLGVRYILVNAAGSPRPGDLNGYYTWARFGFDAGLDEYTREELPTKFASARTLNEWKNNGYATEMIFDLRDDSGSMLVLNAYVAELKRLGKL